MLIFSAGLHLVALNCIWKAIFRNELASQIYKLSFAVLFFEDLSIIKGTICRKVCHPLGGIVGDQSSKMAATIIGSKQQVRSSVAYKHLKLYLLPSMGILFLTENSTFSQTNVFCNILAYQSYGIMPATE